MDIKRVLSLSVNTSSQEYSEQPIPSELDRGLAALVDTVRKTNPINRFLIKRRVSDQHSDILWKFSVRMASLSVREQSSDRILQGLSALVLEGCQEDWRDCLMRFPPLYDAALKIGASPDKLFKNAASYASGDIKELLLTYTKRAPEDLSIEAWGYKEVEAEDGFRYFHQSFG